MIGLDAAVKVRNALPAPASMTPAVVELVKLGRTDLESSVAPLRLMYGKQAVADASKEVCRSPAETLQQVAGDILASVIKSVQPGE